MADFARRRLAHLASLASAVALLVPAPAAHAAGTIHVDDDSTTPQATCGSQDAPCSSIADALAHATGGERVIVAPGDYDGATIDHPVRLEGAQASRSGRDRGVPSAGAPGTTRVHGTLLVSADVSIDGFDFGPVPVGPAIHVAATLPERGTSGSVISNNTFSSVDGTPVISADGAMPALTVSDNAFAGGSGSATTAVFVHGELAGGIPDVLVERNSFTGFSGAAIDAGGVPGVVVRGNEVSGGGSLLSLSDSDGTSQRVSVTDNAARDLARPAITIGSGVVGASIERNQLTRGAQAAIRIDDARGTGATRDVLVRGNDVSGFARAISAAGNDLDGAVIVRGNRFVDVRRTDAAAIENSSTGTVDARRNWWGSNAGPGTSATAGTDVDVTDPLRLIGVDAPATVLMGGSGVVAARLVSSNAGDQADPDAQGFSIAFTASFGAVDAFVAPVRAGRAATYVTAPDQTGTITTIARLDDAQVRGTTRVVGPSAGDGPASAESRPAPRSNRFRARMRPIARMLPRVLTSGFRQVVFTNRPASVRSVYLISHYDARRLGLRSRRNHTHQPFVIARVSTRPVRGRRVVTAPVNPRPAFALRRANLRISVTVVTIVRTRDGEVRNGFRRIVIPATAR